VHDDVYMDTNVSMYMYTSRLLADRCENSAYASLHVSIVRTAPVFRDVRYTVIRKITRY